ncbi:hypothetical protein LCGC14_2708250 [marine sediment metagenome]|uniref:Uncharacterized protein n=1 Tax=marine sediment metagenome TaxID=412755 RepID=A0A0F8ZDP9_9ZZZZ
MTVHTASHLLTREAHKTPRQAVRFAEGLDLATGRVHEFCGGARRTLALMVAGAMAGPVFWIYTPLGLLQLGYAAALNRSAWLTDDEIRKLGPI